MQAGSTPAGLSMSREDKIRKAITDARAKGLKIVRGPCFDWTKPDPDGGPPVHSGELPSACDAIGAMFLATGYKGQWPYEWEPMLEKFSVNGSWIYRFHIGFNIGNQIMIARVVKKKTVYTPDRVCKLGLRLAREYVK